MANRSLFSKFEVRSSGLVRTDGETDRHRSNVLDFSADQMSPGNYFLRSIFLGVTHELTKLIYPL